VRPPETTTLAPGFVEQRARAFEEGAPSVGKVMLGNDAGSVVDLVNQD
jgi:hypothetical protein